MVLIEAMAVSRPVVATRAGGNPEVVQDGRTGLLVERDPAALASGICSLLENAGLRTEMGRAGQRRARELFAASTMAASTEKVYERLVHPVRLRAPWSGEPTSL